MFKVLVIGKSGFLGSHFSLCEDEKFHFQAIGRDQLDLAKQISSSFVGALAASNYNYAVICSAVTDVEECFRNQDLSQQVNVTGTIELLRILQKNKINPIFFSSDYVFKPSSTPRTEDDDRLPQTCYGQQKLAVERFIENNFERYIIFRTSKLMSKTSHPRNILLPIIQSLSVGKEIACFEDQWLNPVFVEDIAEVIKLSIEQELSGAHHLGTQTILSRYELGLLLAAELRLDRNLIKPTSIKAIAFSEPRPSHNTLNCSKIEAKLNYRFTEVSSAIHELKLL